MEPCPKLQKLHILDATGERKTVRQCTEQTSPSFTKTVEPDVCDGCPVRAAVTLREKRGAPPKPSKVKTPHANAKPKTENDCADLKQIIRVKCCGEVLRTNYCNSFSSKLFGELVTPAQCEACPVRRRTNEPRKILIGPGSNLLQLTSDLEMKPTSTCDCVSRAKQMDEWGVDGCREHHGEIIGWLKESFKEVSWADTFRGYRKAKKTKWFRTFAPFESILDEAIRRAEVGI